MHTNSMDWKEGTWRNPAAGPADATVVIGSDWAPIRDFASVILEDSEAVYGDLLPELRSADLRIVNLECPLVDGGAPVWKSGTVLKGIADHVRGLTAVPFEIATLGNNHVFDYGLDGFVRTRELLRDHGIRTIGAGLSMEQAGRPLIETVNGVSVGILNFSEGEDLSAAGEKTPGVYGWEIDRVVEGVRALKAEVSAVIVICHGGVEYIPFPPPYLADAFDRIARAGADLIIGHHPHVPQGIRVHHGVPICYSLGNFVFFQPTDLHFRKIGYLVKASVAENGIARIRLIPYEIQARCLNMLAGEKLERFFKTLESISAPLSDFNGIEAAWHGFLKYYGKAGFREEMDRIMTTLAAEPAKGAAMFRNRLSTLQHRHHLMDLMTRIMDDSLDAAPTWAVERVAEWMTRKINNPDGSTALTEKERGDSPSKDARGER